jgi:hypothetical protein
MPTGLTDSGVAYGRRGSIAKRMVPLGIAGVADLAIAPVAVLEGYWLARRGPELKFIAGEIGRMRLTAPLDNEPAFPCVPADVSLPSLTVPDLPGFEPRCETKEGRLLGDAMNLVFVGSRQDLDSAFSRAGWVGPKPASFGTVSREIVAGLENRQSIGAPLSTQYFRHRPQDLAYQQQVLPGAVRARVSVEAAVAQGWREIVGESGEIVSLEHFGASAAQPVPIDSERPVVLIGGDGCADLVDYVAVKERYSTDATIAASSCHRRGRSSACVQ